MFDNTKGNIVPIKSDKVFHILLNKENTPTLEFVVMHIMNYSYKRVHGHVKVENIRLSVEHTKRKEKYADLVLRIEDTIIIIELNNNYNGNYIRNFLFTCQELLNNYNLPDVKGEEPNKVYKKIAKMVLVNLNWYKSLENIKKYKVKNIIRVPYPDISIRGNVLRIININLDKMAKINYNMLEKSDYFYKLLTINNDVELEEFIRLYDTYNLLDNYKNNLVKISKNIDYTRDK